MLYTALLGRVIFLLEPSSEGYRAQKSIKYLKKAISFSALENFIYFHHQMDGVRGLRTSAARKRQENLLPPLEFM